MSAWPRWFALPRQQKTQSKHRLIALLVRRVMTDGGKTRGDGAQISFSVNIMHLTFHMGSRDLNSKQSQIRLTKSVNSCYSWK